MRKLKPEEISRHYVDNDEADKKTPYKDLVKTMVMLTAMLASIVVMILFLVLCYVALRNGISAIMELGQKPT